MENMLNIDDYYSIAQYAVNSALTMAEEQLVMLPYEFD